MLKFCCSAIITMAASLANAQVQIVESQPIGARASTSTAASQAAATASSAAVQTEMFFQLQLLQQEVLELRGLVEQQAFELRQLKQQRMDDYLDLDRRLGLLSAQPQSSSASATRPANNRVEPVNETVSSNQDMVQAGELTAYRTAIDLILKQRDFDGGAEALKAYLNGYPSGHYAGNAFYWLGQIYLQKDDQAQSEQWFKRLVEQYPDHQKTPEAKFKLAKLYHEKGNQAVAKKMLQEVAASNSAAAGLARDYLKQNF